jgi:hypothetical protein
MIAINGSGILGRGEHGVRDFEPVRMDAVALREKGYAAGGG